MTADTAEIAEVSKAALVIDGIKRSQEQNLHFVLFAAIIVFFGILSFAFFGILSFGQKVPLHGYDST